MDSFHILRIASISTNIAVVDEASRAPVMLAAYRIDG